MNDAAIVEATAREAIALVKADLESSARSENQRFWRDWMSTPEKREKVEKPVYDALKDEPPVQFTHPSLELWKKYGSFTR